MSQQTETVGQRINYVRTQQGLTLERLAQQAGLSKSFLWEVEQDRSGISGKRLLQVADALSASIEYLLRGGSTVETEKPRSIEIPTELSEVAQELGLSYQQTLAPSASGPHDRCIPQWQTQRPQEQRRLAIPIP